jgi:hypothetical protein
MALHGDLSFKAVLSSAKAGSHRSSIDLSILKAIVGASKKSLLFYRIANQQKASALFFDC